VPAKETKTILIVDDEPDTRIFMSNLLASHGYHSIWAENRTDGFHKAMTEDPMAIIIDMMMPDKGGIRLFRDLRQEKKLNAVPVIMLSPIDKDTFFKIQRVSRGRSNTDLRPMEIYLQKPHEAAELLTIIQKISGTSRKAKRPKT